MRLPLWQHRPATATWAADIAEGLHAHYVNRCAHVAVQCGVLDLELCCCLCLPKRCRQIASTSLQTCMPKLPLQVFTLRAQVLYASFCNMFAGAVRHSSSCCCNQLLAAQQLRNYSESHSSQLTMVTRATVQVPLHWRCISSCSGGSTEANEQCSHCDRVAARASDAQLASAPLSTCTKRSNQEKHGD